MFQTYDRGDIIMVEFSPSVGHEQQGYRPALVWNNEDTQRVSGFVMVFPITSHDKGYPLHVPISGHAGNTAGVVMTDQVISLDLMKRKTKKVSHADSLLMDNIAEIVSEMIA